MNAVEKMRVALWYSNHDVRVAEATIPKIGPSEMLVRVEACGICGSDVMEWYRLDRAPLVLGHEIGGRVAVVGAGVSRYKEGDRVTAAHHVPCNTCDFCLAGRHTMCDTLRRTGFDPGGFAEYLRLTPLHVDRGVFLLPDNVSYELATMVEPLACVLRAQRLAGMRPGASVIVVGSGITGLLHVQLAHSLGAKRIMAVDMSDYRLEAARRFGAGVVFKPGADLPQRLREASGGRLADLVIISTGAKAANLQSLELVERGGTVLFFAPTDPGFTMPVAVNELFFRSDITLTTSYAASPSDYQTALDIIAAGSLPIAEMITHRFPMAEVGRGFELVAQAGESLKVVISPHL